MCHSQIKGHEKKKTHTHTHTWYWAVFWPNITKSGVYLRYRHCFKLFRELRKESEKVGISVITLLKFLLTETNCGNVIVEIGKKKICSNCGNVIVKNGRKKNWLPKSGEELKKKVLHPQYFYNIFTRNHRWIVTISSNLNLILRLFF